MKSIFCIFTLLSATCISCQAQPSNIPSPEVQIAGAILAAPEEMRENAQVLGFDDKGNLVELRAGSNELVCVADDPNKEGFSTACYHKNMEPFMSRGRALRAEGIDGQDLFDRREQEAKSGQLEMPETPSTLHILTGTEFSEDSMKVVNAYYRYVVYIPFATVESTGLPSKPRAPGEPWIMDPGTHRAHIMISPPKK
ncbi:MAG: hypothetical protein DHS20C17_27340 [Cyclobacteriaceae bacterium]|nr:MAG: hypothetical protein DHS20C17_27340 [Cyclobacteriaceae bacterium]